MAEAINLMLDEIMDDLKWILDTFLTYEYDYSKIDVIIARKMYNKFFDDKRWG